MFMQMCAALLLYNLVNQPNEVFYKMSVFTVRCVLEGVTNSVSPAAECITHTFAHALLSDTEYINILDVLYFKLVRMFQSFLIKVTCCCFFLPLGKQRAFLCFCP